MGRESSGEMSNGMEGEDNYSTRGGQKTIIHICRVEMRLTWGGKK